MLLKGLLSVGLVLAALLALAALVLEKWERPSSSFDSRDELAALIATGWVPDWIPSSAFDIEESHDIDTNEVWMRFRFSKVQAFYRSPLCQPLPVDEGEKVISLDGTRFPSSFAALQQRQASASFSWYVCGSEPLYMAAVDESEQLAFLWSSGRGQTADIRKPIDLQAVRPANASAVSE